MRILHLIVYPRFFSASGQLESSLEGVEKPQNYPSRYSEHYKRCGSGNNNKKQQQKPTTIKENVYTFRIDKLCLK